MGGVFELCQYPKLLSGDYSCNEVFDIVVYLIVCHGSNHDVVIVWDTLPATDNEVKPFVGHTTKVKDRERLVWSVFVGVDGGGVLSQRPSSSLPLQFCTIEPFSEIFSKLACPDLRIGDFEGTAMKNSHKINNLIVCLPNDKQNLFGANLQRFCFKDKLLTDFVGLWGVYDPFHSVNV